MAINILHSQSRGNSKLIVTVVSAIICMDTVNTILWLITDIKLNTISTCNLYKLSRDFLIICHFYSINTFTYFHQMFDNFVVPSLSMLSLKRFVTNGFCCKKF